MQNNLWILGEEGLRSEPIKHIIEHFAELKNTSTLSSGITFRELTEGSSFTGLYKVGGIKIPGVDNIFYEIVSGSGSFVDYIVFNQESRPTPEDEPDLLVEDNKSRPSDAGNMHKQRLIKFVNAEWYYPSVSTLYLNVVPNYKRKSGVSPAYERSARLFNTLGVKVKLVDFSGEDRTPSFNPFGSVEEMLEAFPIKERKGTVPTGLTKIGNNVYISTKLLKGDNGLSDPGVGFIGGASMALRILGHTGDIKVLNHKLSDEWFMRGRKSKLAKISSTLGVEFETSGRDFISLVYTGEDKSYWTRKTNGEKHATILLDIVMRRCPECSVIYDNHAGTERGWFVLPSGERTSVAKNIGGIPDLVVKNEETKEILVFEGEMYKNAEKGVVQFQTFKGFKALLQEHYPEYDIKFHLILNGGCAKMDNTYFQLTEDGDMVFDRSADGYAV